MRLRWSVASLIVMAASIGYAQLPSTTTVEAPGGAITITALGHASVQLEQGGKVVIVDPVAMMADLSKAKPADIILITDIHGDHYDPAAVAKLRKPNAPVVVPQAVADMKQIPNPTVMVNATMRTNDQALAGLTIISVPAYNVQRGPSPGQFYHPRGRGQGYVVAFSDKLAAVRQNQTGQVYIAGDTECVPAMTTWVTNVNVAIMPMNLPYTMTPAEAADAVKAFRPKIVYPYHYKGSNLDEFATPLKGTGIDVRIRDWYGK